MSKDQIKSEINKVLDHFSDKGLEEILLFLKKLVSEKQHDNTTILQKILKEDTQLLKKLAQ
jgi:hypothetical protein